MPNILRKYTVEKLNFPVSGGMYEKYDYNVQTFVSIDGGKNYYYCGVGRFCKTEAEAEAYCEKHNSIMRNSEEATN